MFQFKHPNYYKKIKKDFYKEAKKKQKELDESYKESVRQTKERKDLTNKNKYDRENDDKKIQSKNLRIRNRCKGIDTISIRANIRDD